MTADPPSNIARTFGLKRENFILDPIRDHECFARNDIRTREIAESLDIDVVTGLAPKRLVWGPYGGGKTHTLMRTMAELEVLTGIHAVRIECPDLSKKARFHDLYREGIMRGLGQDFVIGLMEEVVHKVGYKPRQELHAELKEWFGDEELAKAAEQLYNPNFERLKLWRWISGVAMSRADLNELGQSQDLTQTEAARLADVLVTLGRLLRRLHDKTLVLILDEMERLMSIGPETITTFVSGFTRLVDPNQVCVSVLIGTSAALESEMVDVFSEVSSVTSRLGAENKLEIPALAEPDVDRFIEGIVAYVRADGFDVKSAMASVGDKTAESLVADSFPFTREAVEALKSKIRTLTPREITMQMTRALGRAHRKGLSVITVDCVA